MCKCPHCGKELTDIAVRLQELKRNHEDLEEKVQEILARVFDNEELGSIADRFGTIHPHKIAGDSNV